MAYQLIRAHAFRSILMKRPGRARGKRLVSLRQRSGIFGRTRGASELQPSRRKSRDPHQEDLHRNHHYHDLYDLHGLYDLLDAILDDLFQVFRPRQQRHFRYLAKTYDFAVDNFQVERKDEDP